MFKRVRPPLFVLCLVGLVLASGAHAPLKNALADLRFDWLARQATGKIVFVAIDSPSIDEFGVWPWPRELHARLVEQLRRAGAGAIAFDVDLSSPSNPGSDEVFANTLKKAGGSVVLPAFEQVISRSGERSMHVNRPLPQFAANAWTGVVNVTVGPDGLVRQYPYGQEIEGQFLPSIGALLAGKFEKAKAPLRIDFGISSSGIPAVSYADVLRGEPGALAKVKGKNVLIGASAVELGDRFTVPNGAVIPGALLQILAAESILQQRALQDSSDILNFVLLAGIVLLMTLTWQRLSAGRRAALLGAVSVGVEACAVAVQAKLPVILDTSLIQAAVAAYFVALALDEIDFRALLGLIAERRFHRVAMSLGEGLVCADEQGIVSFWNDGAKAIFGYTADEIAGRPLSVLYNSSGGSFVQSGLPQGSLQSSGGGLLVEVEGRRKNGDTFPLEICFSEWQAIDGRHYGAIMRDISDRKREAERIRYLAEHDTLTGLANRNRLHQCVEAMMSAAEPVQIALAMLDLDKFKQINDTLGHGCGDEVLWGVAEHLRSLAPPDAVVARLGGDEFAILLGGEAALARARELADRACKSFAELSFPIGARQIRVEVSVGIATYPQDSTSLDDLLGNADLALYEAKARGRGQYVVFEPEFRERLAARLSLEAELVRAARTGEFELFYQPQIDLESGALVGAEALIRWRHPTRGLIFPDAFMPTVNASSISDEIGVWSLRTACRQARRWEEHGHSLRIGVNLAPSQFLADELPKTVQSMLQETGLRPDLLELEVTENILLDDDELALSIFQRIQALGVHIAFDDFGTGYASLTYLKKFPLDRLKIDKSFVSKLISDADDMAIVGATIALAKLLGLSVIAEGIEDAETADLLARKGCKEGQGYHFGKPMPVDEFERKFLGKERVPVLKREPAAA
jgi:diguanylate cyclase (GGDEF)-like protein/PAS domain S-box-containing protein